MTWKVYSELETYAKNTEVDENKKENRLHYTAPVESTAGSCPVSKSL